MMARHKKLEGQIKDFKAKVKKYPKGELVCTKNGNYYKWYKSDGHNKIYISRKDKYLAEQLAKKKYLNASIEYLEKEQIAITSYLKRHPINEPRLLWILDENSKYNDLLSDFPKPLSKHIVKELLDWMDEPYESNPYNKEGLIHKTESGKLVRSKSEVHIDMLLSKYKIPFRYEAKLELGNHVCYPDFTIRHPKTLETYYWENFGMMDDPVYVEHFLMKIKNYISNGIIPGVNLIMTFETSDKPLTVDRIVDIIESYFCD